VVPQRTVSWAADGLFAETASSIPVLRRWSLQMRRPLITVCLLLLPGCDSGECEGTDCNWCSDHPQSCCNGARIDTNTDEANCGTCGNACGPGKVCQAGTCVCPPPFGDCNGTCVDLHNDPENCGACGKKCAADRTCSVGWCLCADGLTDCNGTCRDTSSDDKNCGTCGNRCDTTKGLTCVAGTCACADASETECSGVCVDTSSDPNNCGACGGACFAYQSCDSGSCDPPGALSIAATCAATAVPAGGTTQCIAVVSPTQVPLTWSTTAVGTCPGGAPGTINYNKQGQFHATSDLAVVGCKAEVWATYTGPPAVSSNKVVIDIVCPSSNLCDGACVDLGSDGTNCGAAASRAPSARPASGGRASVQRG